MFRLPKINIDRFLLTLIALAGIVFSLHLLYSALCAFSWKNFLMMDYGAYTNFLYNLAHGDGFRFLLEHNYLKTHLSFSFILLTPLVHLWDSPLLLIFTQWFFLMGGAALLWQTLRRSGVEPILSAALIFSFVASPMTQSILLSEFHGVSAYFLLLPWLLHTILFHRRWAFLPLLVLLGLREDAGLVVFPLLLYFAIRDRWKIGYVLAGAALAYVAIALFVLYPWINGESLFGVRAAEASAISIGQSFAFPCLLERAEALGWLFFPAIFLGICYRRAWIPLLLFPSAALLQALGSAMERQHGLTFHYPAAAFTALSCAMAIVLARPETFRWNSAKPILSRLVAASLLVTTLTAHAANGFFLGGQATQRIYTRSHPQFHCLMRLAHTLPKEGLLLCNQDLAPYFAHRADIMVMHFHDPEHQRPEFILTHLHELQTPGFTPVVAAIEAGEFGLFDTEFPYLVLRRGHSTRDNPHLLQAIREHRMVPALMSSLGGDVVYEPGHGLLKQWSGTEGNIPVTLGRAISLPPGDYIAQFRMRVPAISPPPPTGYGTCSVRLRGDANPLAECPVVPTDGDLFADQLLPFSLDAKGLVEPLLFSGGSPLQIQSIRLRSVDDR